MMTTYTANEIQNKLVDTAGAVFGVDVETVINSGGESIKVMYGGYTLSISAQSMEQAADPDKIMLSFHFGNHAGLKLISLKTAKNVLDVVMITDKNWYVVRESGGKFADGWYGFDGNIHSDEQIFAEDELPYKPDADGIENILVGTGEKPSIMQVTEHLINLEKE